MLTDHHPRTWDSDEYILAWAQARGRLRWPIHDVPLWGAISAGDPDVARIHTNDQRKVTRIIGSSPGMRLRAALA